MPGTQKQGERLTPQFQRLQEVMDKQRIALQNNPLGIQPEQVLVLETIGSIENLFNAIKKIEGLEWLGELELDDIAPDYGFEDEKDPQKQLKGQLFLVLTDQRALQELLRLFLLWKQDNAVEFPEGLAPLKNVFVHLHTIRPWDAEDRIRDTGLFEDWQERVNYGQEIVPFEVELWFRENIDRRRQAQVHLGMILESLGGTVVQQCVIPQIAYHGILGRIPINQFANILSELSKVQNFRLFQCEDIMYVRPLGQCAIQVPEDLSDLKTIDIKRRPSLPQGEPVVALFDGLPLTGHQLLRERLIVDDPDDYERTYQARDRVHGTAMASLICHGDLDEDSKPLERPVYVRPIMQPYRGFDGRVIERIPEEVLPVDLIHRAVRRLYESENGEAPAGPYVRIINLSVCDHSRPFDRSISPLARLLDWLSWKYNVLFLVSGGNHSHDIELTVPRLKLRSMTPEEMEKAVIESTVADTRNRRLLSPAETYNGLTLGATHTDASTPAPSSNLFDPFSRSGLPSTISPHGPGYRRSIKPDLFLPGGRQFVFEKLGNTHIRAVLQTREFGCAPGQLVATPGPAGQLDRTMYTRGTSNAAALASRWAALLLDVIGEIRMRYEADLPQEYDVVLLKTLLVHGTEWGDAGRLYESILRNKQNSRTFRDYVGRFLGYGLADVRKVMVCTEQRVTVLGVGKLGDGEGDEFRFPLPPSLSALAEKRRLTITLAWLSPINCQRHNYRVAHLWFNPKNALATDRICADYHAVQRGTVQHEVLESAKAATFQDGENIAVKVSCRADAGDIPEPVRYGLAVTLEIAEAINIPIYQEVRDRLRIRERIT